MFLSGGYRSSKQKLIHESLDLKTNLKHVKKQKFHYSRGTISFYMPRGLPKKGYYDKTTQCEKIQISSLTAMFNLLT